MAGARAESRVTPTPTSAAMTIVRGSSAMPAVGMSTPRALNSRLMPLATPRPATMPTAEARTPSVSASATTERSTWRRLAPRARSIANSRRRCATVMLKALKMMNAPTKTETPANARSTGVRNAGDGGGRLGGGVGGRLLTGLDAHRRRHLGFDARGELFGGDAGVGGDRDAAQLARLTAPALHVLQAAGDDDGAAHGAGVAPREHAGDLDVLEAGRSGDVEAVARLRGLACRRSS